MQFGCDPTINPDQGPTAPAIKMESTHILQGKFMNKMRVHL